MLIFPLLNTDRLKLRKIEIDDFPALIRYANNKNISDNIINIPHPYREPDAVFRLSYVVRGFKDKSRYVFAIVLKESAELIGEIGLHITDNNAELGYWIGEPMWNNGYASEAIDAILTFGFDVLKLNTIYASCHNQNTASKAVLIKNRMNKVGVNGNVVQYAVTNPLF